MVRRRSRSTKSDQERLAQDFMALVRQFNQANDGTMAWPADYLEVVATKQL